MRTRNFTTLLMSLLVLAMVGCGGGGGAGQPSGMALSGTAMKGPIAGGTVKVFEIVSSATLNPRAGIPRYGITPLLQTTTGSDGKYSLTIPSSLKSNSLMVQITGGSYTDEATGASKNVATEFGADGLRAVFSNLSGAIKRGEAVNAAVTPLTEMAVADAGPNPTDAAITSSNSKIAAAFGLTDIVNILPLDPTKPFPAGASSAAQQYALALATVSQYQKDFGAGQSIGQIITTLTAQINDPPNNGGLAPATEVQIEASTNNFAGSTSNPNPVLNTPAVNPSAPASIILTANALRGVTGGAAVVLSANVTDAAGGPVPNGTVVSFSIASGSGTLSGATATTGGVATVSLTSSVAAASVGVTATAGAATTLISVPFIAQPTQAIVKVRSSGTLATGILIGGINATVNYATNKGLSIVPGAVAASGVASNVLLEPNTNTSGRVVLGLITSSGIGLGEFATLTFSVAAGNFPTEADFSMAAGSVVINTLAGDLPGVAAEILSVTIQ